MSPDSEIVSERSPDAAKHLLRWHLSAIGICAVHVLLVWWDRAPGVRTAHDDAIYLTLARSLRHGGYNELYHIGTPLHAQYPPGYPALLALWGTVFGTSFDAAVVAGMLASALALFLVYRVVEKLSSPLPALAILAVLAVNPYLVARAGTVYAETPYMLLSLACVTVLAWQSKTNRTLVVAGATAVAAALTRSIGVALIVALVVHWLLERRYKAALTLGLPCAATVGAWLVWTAISPHQAVGKTYVADLQLRPSGVTSLAGILAVRVVHNVKSYLEVGIPYQMPFPTIPGTVVDNAIGAGLLVVGLVAGIWLLWKRWRIAALYLLATGGLLSVWPWATGRYTLPVLPLVLPAVFLGLGELAGRVRPKWRMPVILGLAGITFLTGVRRTAGEIGTASACDRSSFPFPPSYTCMIPEQAADQVSYFSALDYIRSHVPQHARFLAVMAEPLWYYTGRQSVFYPDALSRSDEGFLPFLRSKGADWILLGDLRYEEPGRMADLIQANCSSLRLVASFPPRTYLFRLQAAGPGDGGPAACRAMQRYRAAVRPTGEATARGPADGSGAGASGGTGRERPAPPSPLSTRAG